MTIKPFYNLTVLLILALTSQLCYAQKQKNIPFGKSDREGFMKIEESEYQFDAIRNTSFEGYQVVKVNNDINELDIIRIDIKTSEVDTIKHLIRYKEYASFKSYSFDISAVNIPIKVRGSVDTIPGTTELNISNLGLYFGGSINFKRYFFSGNTSNHSFSFGAFLSPTAISMNAANTRGEVESASQFGISTGLGLTYRYDKLSVIIIPLATDIGIGSETDKWIYNKTPWLGFGLGFDIGFFKG